MSVLIFIEFVSQEIRPTCCFFVMTLDRAKFASPQST